MAKMELLEPELPRVMLITPAGVTLEVFRQTLPISRSVVVTYAFFYFKHLYSVWHLLMP